MNIGLYQSASSLSALERWQDAVAQNITSSQVTGYRERTVQFSGVSTGQLQTGSGTSSADTTTAVFPSASNGVNFATGSTQPTGRELDVAIQGPGFFEVQLPDGTHGYTRNGEFSSTADRALVTTSGAQVLSDNGSPISLSPNGGPITIKADGTLLQGTTNLGRIGIQNFASNSSLTPIAGGVFVANDGSAPEPVTKPDVLQGYLEASNVSPMREMVDMVLISRSYEANQKVIKTADQNSQKAIEALG